MVPLAMAGANSTAGLVATAALTGGPVAAAVAATGAVVLGTVAATRTARQSRTGRKRNQPRSGAGSASGSSPRRTGAGGLAGVPSQSRRSGRSSAAGGRGGGTAPGLMSRSGGLAIGSKSRTGKGSSAGGRGGRSPLGSGCTPVGRLGQVKALRQAQKQKAPTRAAARTQGTQDRRKVADARRAAKSAARTARSGTKGGIGRAVSKGMGQVGRMRDAAVGKARAARDRRAQNKVDGKRSSVRHAAARRRARSALWRSALRMQGRRLLAAVLSAPLGVLGMLTTPLGRKLGWRWLMYPGRRFYRRLMGAARLAREERDRAIRAAQDNEEAAADAAAEDDDVIGDRVQRPAQLIPGVPAPQLEVNNVSGFRFEEAAAEMENAARSYDPDGSMEILAMVEGLPEALRSVANTFQILAERSDSEFPLEKDVAYGFDGIFQALMNAVDAAEDLGPLFRQAHEADIARHEDPRNGPEAEKGWNV
ncbi:hypothetical protein [Streptomyces sp. S4.7]|uniref:hypothetical protein n=1 Tax=Streptomyces sp. S4.7 TaxID=2705439 RepID=UPI001EF1EB94|nr:hypothetical protein [Streptomyces sp. S4.7]